MSDFDSGLGLDISMWNPDVNLIAEQEEFRREREWKRNSSKGSSLILKPSEIGIEGYRYTAPLHPKFYEGRTPPNLALESSENIEWYSEQLRRCIYGFEYKGTRITGDYYWFLNFTPFSIAKKDALGNPTTEFEIKFPYHSSMADYTFKLIEEAHASGKVFMEMAGRGVGKEQPISEPVFTPTGQVTIGSLKIGDKVISKDGYPTTVLNIFPQGKKDVYKLVLEDGRSVRCGIEHLWPVATEDKVELLLTTEQILNYKDTLYLPIGKGVISKDKPLMVSPSVLGEAYVGELDYEYGDPCIKELNTKSSIKSYLEAFRLDDTVSISDRRFSIKVFSLGYEQKIKILKSIIRKIGVFNEKTNTYTIELISPIKCKEVQLIARSVGLYAKRFGLSTLKIISNRQLGFEKHISVSEEANRVQILGVVKLPYKEESVCISVDHPSHTYLTTDYVVTHNTYNILSILAKTYHLKPNSRSFVSASNSGHANEAFIKMTDMVNDIGKVHPTIALARLKDSASELVSGQKVVRDGIPYEEGHLSHIQKIIYGDNPGVTKGSRPDAQLMEEIGAWSTGPGNLKDCISSSLGSWRVGAIRKCRVFMIGTGGSVTSDQARDIFFNPTAFDCLTVNDFKKKTCFFLPADYCLGGAGWERTGVNNNEYAREVLTKERERIISDIQLYRRVVQEYPFTPEEVFKKMGTNKFNQEKLAHQYIRLTSGDLKDNKPEVGFLEWIRRPNGEITGVRFVKNPEGDIHIVEHPYKGPEGEEYKDLYVMGLDSIDQGILDSSSSTDGSKIASLVKKRIISGEMFSTTSSLYVAMYLKRSNDVRDDYDNVLKLAVYYDTKINVEYTKIGVISYFREKRQYHRFMKRPIAVLPNSKNLDPFEPVKPSTQLGTPATLAAIDHQDSKVEEYINDYSYQILFADLLEQLRDYDPSDRRKFDLVIAMGLAELADEDYLGAGAEKAYSPCEELEVFGYYNDPQTGYKRYGVLPKSNTKSEEEKRLSKSSLPPGVRYYSADGTPHY